jgi:hypothetical protein
MFCEEFKLLAARRFPSRRPTALLGYCCRPYLRVATPPTDSTDETNLLNAFPGVLAFGFHVGTFRHPRQSARRAALLFVSVIRNEQHGTLDRRDKVIDALHRGDEPRWLNLEDAAQSPLGGDRRRLGDVRLTSSPSRPRALGGGQQKLMASQQV